MGECPWNPAHRLALIGLRAKDVTARQQPPLNLVFLIDKSGSMQPANKLPLIKGALRLLVRQLSARDRVAVVVYASESRVLLPSTRGDDHETILAAIEELSADGSTNGGAGIQDAYHQATRSFIEGGVNRVILCTDGDFNVGITDDNSLVRLIQEKARTGVFLNVFGFGMGNVKDSKMEKLADKGNGQYAYIDDLEEARKVLVDDARKTLITVAKDVKLQIEFNPAHVRGYRLIGYENRVMAARDFNNDRKDAGDLGAGHTVTALYEIIPTAGNTDAAPLRYQPSRPLSDEWMTIKLRYKEPDADTSKLLTTVIKDSHLRWRSASEDFRFAAAVAGFGLLLRGSPDRADANYDLVLELANDARHRDPNGYRSEFIDLVKRARRLASQDR
jgi:Ca-activated chloride channel family protein